MRVRFDVNDPKGRDAMLSDTLPRALEGLTAGATALWGGMTAQQMVEHLLWGFEASTGVIDSACPTPEEKRAQVRPFLYSNRSMPHGFESPLLKAGLPVLRFASLPQACAATVAAAQVFLGQSDAERAMLRAHPLFGPLDGELWSRNHFKHCVHHLLQFGLIEVDEVERGEKPHARS